MVLYANYAIRACKSCNRDVVQRWLRFVTIKLACVQLKWPEPNMTRPKSLIEINCTRPAADILLVDCIGPKVWPRALHLDRRGSAHVHLRMHRCASQIHRFGKPVKIYSMVRQLESRMTELHRISDSSKQ